MDIILIEMQLYLITCEAGWIQFEERRRDGTLQVIVGDVEHLKVWRVDSRYSAREVVVVEADLNHPRRRQRLRDGAGETIVGQINLLQRLHALKGIISDLAGEVVVGQIQRHEGSKFAPVGHGALEVIVDEADRAKVRQLGQGVHVDLSLQAHVIELQRPHVPVVTEHARPIPSAWIRRRNPIR